MTDLTLVHEVGMKYTVNKAWETGNKLEDYHVHEFIISRHQFDELVGSMHSATSAEFLAKLKPTKCVRCGCAYKDEKLKEPYLMEEPLYDTPDGTIHPGDMWYSKQEHRANNFKNPDDKYLMVMLPDKWVWDSDSRAHNCTKPKDYVHRCWVKDTKNGVENMTVGKTGITCNAGAGSIMAANGGWHGFIRKGMFVKA